MVHRTIWSLLAQSVRPTAILLALSEDEFPERERDLPPGLRKVMREMPGQVLVEYVPGNDKSYKKLVPATKIFGTETVFITVDDDVYYPETFVESLLEAARAYPHATIGTRGTKILVDKGEVRGYDSWPAAPLNSCQPSTFLTGRGGILYPAGSLTGLNADRAYLTCAPTSDDIWFKFLSLSNGFEALRTGTGIEFPGTGASQSVALYRSNLRKVREEVSPNDLAVIASMRHFRVPISRIGG